MHLLLLLLLQGAPPQENRSELIAELRPALEELTDWCDSKHLFRTRNELAGALLRLDPDLKRARRWLGFKRNRDGEWVPPRRPPRSRDSGKKFLEELEQRRTQLMETFGPRLRALHDDPSRPLDEKWQLAADLVALQPDDESSRALIGEARDGDAWILQETARSRVRRPWIKEVGDQSVVDVPEPEEEPLAEWESAVPLGWQQGFGTEHVRVQGTVSGKEMQEAAIALEACVPFYDAVMKPARKWDRRYTVYLILDKHDGILLLRHYRFDPAKLAELVRFDGEWWPEKRMILDWDNSPEERLDGTVRLLLRCMMYRDFRDLTPWVHEGVGMYLGQKITGTTLSWYYQPDRYGGKIDKQVIDKLLLRDSNWMEVAHELLDKDAVPNLHQLLYTHLNRLTTADYLFSYALAGYWIEGRPDDVQEHLRLLGHRQRPEEALASAGLTFPVLQERFLRWMEETKEQR